MDDLKTKIWQNPSYMSFSHFARRIQMCLSRRTWNVDSNLNEIKDIDSKLSIVIVHHVKQICTENVPLEIKTKVTLS